MIDEHEVIVPSGGLALSVSGLALSVTACAVPPCPPFVAARHLPPAGGRCRVSDRGRTAVAVRRLRGLACHSRQRARPLRQRLSALPPPPKWEARAPPPRSWLSLWESCLRSRLRGLIFPPIDTPNSGHFALWRAFLRLSTCAGLDLRWQAKPREDSEHPRSG